MATVVSPYRVQFLTEFEFPFQVVLYLRMVAPAYHALLLSVGKDSSTVLLEAYHHDTLVGLGLAQHTPDSPRAEIVSLYVDEAHQGKGLGEQLLVQLELRLRQRGVQRVSLSYETGQPTTPALEHLLHKYDWSQPETTLIVAVAHRDQLKEMKWLYTTQIPDGFSTFMWKDISEAEKQAIRERQQRENWYPEMVSPFNEEAIIEPDSSIGARHDSDGELAGWMITHRIAAQAVRFTSRFVSPPYRLTNLGMYLIAESVRRQVEAGTVARGVWHFPPDNKTTIWFTERVIKPYLSAKNEIRRSSKVLNTDQEGLNS